MAIASQNSTPLHGERDFALGVAGFSYSDLYRPERLAALLERFDSELAAADAALAIAELRAIEAAHDLVRKGKATALPAATLERQRAIVAAWPGAAGREPQAVISDLLAIAERWARARNAAEHRRPPAERSALF